MAEATPAAADEARRTEDLPPLAAPLDTVLATLFDSPATLRELLQSLNEHRRAVDLVWVAHQMGAVQLPPGLATRIERARTSWPSVLGSSSLAALPS